MRFRSHVAVLLLSVSALAGAQVLKCDRRQGWTMDGEFCARCDIVFGGQMAKKQAYNICLNCSSGCPYTKSERPNGLGSTVPAISTCGILTAPPKLATPAEQMPVAVRLDPEVIERAADRYPIAAAFLAVMASKPEAPNVFDAGSVTLGLRHLPRQGTAMALVERGDEAMQAPFVTELPLFENVVVEARGERLVSGGIAWWLLASLETRKGSRVLEGPVRVVLADSGSRVSTSVGNMGVLAPVMTIESVE